MDMIKYNIVFQMDREAPLTKHNWMCELSSSPRTKHLPSLCYTEELISILTSPLLIHWHILSSCHCTNTLKSFWDIWKEWCLGKILTQEHFTIVEKTVHTCYCNFVSVNPKLFTTAFIKFLNCINFIMLHKCTPFKQHTFWQFFWGFAIRVGVK